MSEDSADTETYALTAESLPEITAPDLPYLPPEPASYAPRIGLIGTGGISSSHLDAYKTAGWSVVALCDRTRSKAEEKGAEFFPQARIDDTAEILLADPDIDVVDIALPTEVRAPVVEAALKAGKHVLSQKPFVLDLDRGEDLVKLAVDMGVQLAVNQNGRWSPHMAWMREATRAGHIGDVLSFHANVHWDHSWTAGTPFDDIEDLILYDFGIHWFDFLHSIAGERIETVYSTASAARGQTNKVPLLAQSLVKMDRGQASLVFDGAVAHGPRDTTFIGGTEGSLISDGPDLGHQTLTLTTPAGYARPKLAGAWFNDGFRGAMGELLCAIESGRRPMNSAEDNLKSLALTFAAIKLRHVGRELEVGTVRSITASQA